MRLIASEHNCKECKFGEFLYENKCNCGCDKVKMVWKCNTSKGRGIRKTEIYRNGRLIDESIRDLNEGTDYELGDRRREDARRNPSSLGEGGIIGFLQTRYDAFGNPID